MKTDAYIIFYTDDDADDQDFFKDVLSDIGGNHRLFMQSYGDALLQQLDHPPPAPDIVFLDLNMPVKNGHQVLEEIRRSPKYKDLPVVVFSTSDDEGMIDKSKKLGASLYVHKPNSYQRFKKVLASVLALDWPNYRPAEADFLYRNS